MTDRAPKLLFDALAAIAAAQEFVAGCSLSEYINEIVYLTVTQDLEVLREQLTQVLAARG